MPACRACKRARRAQSNIPGKAMQAIRLKLIKGGLEGELLAQGWVKQTTIGEPRLSEIVENYQRMGYEVYVVEHPVVENTEDCNICHAAGAEIGQVSGDVYLRKRGDVQGLEEELF